MDHGVDRAQRVHLLGHGRGLGPAGEVADHDVSAPCGEFVDGGSAVLIPSVDDDVMSAREQLLGGAAAEPGGGAGDEHDCHGQTVRRVLMARRSSMAL